jgi:hypothetical protein
MEQNFHSRKQHRRGRLALFENAPLFFQPRPAAGDKITRKFPRSMARDGHKYSLVAMQSQDVIARPGMTPINNRHAMRINFDAFGVVRVHWVRQVGVGRKQSEKFSDTSHNYGPCCRAKSQQESPKEKNLNARAIETKSKTKILNAR